jgi:dimethylhistidine N-methyltransferase
MSTPAFALSKIETEFAEDVRAGLVRAGQKELPSSWLYDDLGSALFEAITCLPEYGLTRAEERILESHSREIADRVGNPVLVVELGSGGGRKTSHILKAVGAQQADLRYCPVDVSAAALRACARELAPYAEVRTIEASYLAGLSEAGRWRRPDERLFVLFLGSTIGNFDRAGALDFLTVIGAQMRSGDALLLGADLVKPVDQLLEAYDDPTGVTAAFNRNLLGRVNVQLGADFDLRLFAHEARYDADFQRVEMHLRATEAHTVAIPMADCSVSFEKGETIWTESSHKYHLHQLEDMARTCGFRPAARWIDPDWPFAELLWVRP